MLVENKGNVEHRFRRISLHLRGIKRGEPIVAIQPVKKVLEFPAELVTIRNLVPKDVNYFFVRPKVKVRMTRPFVVPADIQFLHLYAEFEYEQRDFVHSAQRVYEVPFAYSEALTPSARADASDRSEQVRFGNNADGD